MLRNSEIPRPEGYTQVCVWPATMLGDSDPDDFAGWALRELGARVVHLEDVETLPDVVDGKEVPGTGGRIDMLFAVHSEDVGKMMVRRLMHGISWIEDALANHGDAYPSRLREYATW